MSSGQCRISAASGPGCSPYIINDAITLLDALASETFLNAFEQAVIRMTARFEPPQLNRALQRLQQKIQLVASILHFEEIQEPWQSGD